MSGLVKRMAGGGCMVEIEGIGHTPVHLMLSGDLPDIHSRSIVAMYELFLQSVRLFSTKSNVACYEQMFLVVHVRNFGRVEEWFNTVRK